MATSTIVSCGICLKNGNDKAAIIWCPDCESALCNLCRDGHDQSNKTINHKTTTVEMLYSMTQIPIRSKNTLLGLAQKFNVEKSNSERPEIRAFCLLPNKDFVFVDGVGVFTICSFEGSFKERFALHSGGINDIAPIDNSTVVISRGQHSVNLVDINKKTKVMKIKTQEFCFGIEHYRGLLYLCVYGRSLWTAKLSDCEASRFYSYKHVSVCYVTMCKSNICISDAYEDYITLLDSSAKIIWKFADKELLSSPSKLTSDANGNIYVVGEASYNVVFVSSDGKKSRQLLGREDGIENVAGIHYDKDRKVLIIVNIFGNVVFYNCQ